MLQIIDSSLKQRFKPIFPSRALNCHLRFTLRGGVDDTEQNHFTLSQLFVYFGRFKKVTTICNIGTEVQKIFSKSNIIYKMFILQVTKKKRQSAVQCCWSPILQKMLHHTRPGCYLDTSAILLAKVNKLLAFSQQSNEQGMHC